jgi:hypothetical protein
MEHMNIVSGRANKRFNSRKIFVSIAVEGDRPDCRLNQCKRIFRFSESTNVPLEFSTPTDAGEIAVRF